MVHKNDEGCGLMLQGLYPHASSQISRAAFQMFYNPEQQQQMQPGEEDLGQPPPQ